MSRRLSPTEVRRLVRAARAGLRRAHAPYSGFHVGAAVLTDRGRVIVGCNVENASYGLSNCAERVAIQRAVAEGARRVRAVAVSTGSGPTMPCGACRQVMAEFGVRHVVIDDPVHGPTLYTLEDLLPHAFGPKSLTQDLS